MKKILHKEEYKGMQIEIQGRFKSKVSTWNNGITDVVYLDYYVYSGDEYKEESEYLIQAKAEYQTWKVEKEKPFKFIFWTLKPDKSFKEKVEEKISRLTQYIKDQIEKDMYERDMTENLLGSIERL